MQNSMPFTWSSSALISAPQRRRLPVSGGEYDPPVEGGVSLVFHLTAGTGIEIKLFELQDAAAVYAVVDRGREYLRHWLPWVDYTHSPDDICNFITRVRGQFEAGQGPQAGLWVDGQFAGSVGCHPINWQNRNCSIGYWIAREHQGKGIVTRCCATLLDYLFNELRLHRVTIECGTGNTKSCAIPKRLGFTREGTVRHGEWVNDRWVDLKMWSMLENEWRGADHRILWSADSQSTPPT